MCNITTVPFTSRPCVPVIGLMTLVYILSKFSEKKGIKINSLNTMFRHEFR